MKTKNGVPTTCYLVGNFFGRLYDFFLETGNMIASVGWATCCPRVFIQIFRQPEKSFIPKNQLRRVGLRPTVKP